jgi:hypothetical protein
MTGSTERTGTRGGAVFNAVMGLGALGLLIEGWVTDTRWLIALSAIAVGGYATRLRWGPRS